MKLRRFSTLFLAILMVLSVALAGCTGNEPAEPQKTAAEETTPTAAPTDDPTEAVDPTGTPGGENTPGATDTAAPTDTVNPTDTAEPTDTASSETPTNEPQDSETPAGETETPEANTGDPTPTSAGNTPSNPTPTPTAGATATATPTPTPTPTDSSFSADSNIFDKWDNSVKDAIGTLKQTIVEMTAEGLKVKDERNGGTSGASGDPYFTLNVAKYSSLTGKTALSGTDGSYIVFKIKSENTDGDFEVFTQTPKAGDSGKSAYIQTGTWQYIIVDMTATTLVSQAKLSTIRVDWASLYIKPTGWMVISEIAFFANKKDAYAHAGVPLDPASSSQMTDKVTFPTSGDSKKYVILDNGTATLKSDGGMGVIEIVSSGSSQKVTLDIREAAATQKSSASRKRYIAIKMKTVGNAAATVTLVSYTDLAGKTVNVETKGDLTATESGWQGMYFDLAGKNTAHASTMKIVIRIAGLTRDSGKILIGDIIFTDDLNVALETCGLSQYKLNNSGVSYTDPLASSKLTAPNEDSSVSVWFDHSTEKVVQNDAKSTGRSGYTISMAKNEAENAQFFVSPSKDMRINVTVDDFSDGKGHKLTPELSYEFYHNLANVMRPDALIPMSEPVNVKAGNSQAFMIRVTTTADTPAGTYNSIVHVFNADTGKEIKRAPVAVKVYNFTLSDETALRTAFALWDISDGYPAGGAGYDGAEWGNVIYNYYEFFFKYRINIMDIYSGITSSRGVKYMQNPRLNTARWSNNDYSVWQDLQNDGYTEKPMWLSKIIYYPGECDEPREEWQFKALKSVAEQIAGHDPDYKMVIPVERDLQLKADGTIVKDIDSSDYDSVGFLMKYTNIYCPKLDAFTPRELSRRGGTSFLQSLAQDKKYGSFMDRMREGVKNGGELWSYICINPTQPYCNWQIPSDGTETIVSLWQMKQLGVTGMLYWNVDYWKVNYWNTSEPWSTATTASVGDGILIYSGHLIHSVYPIPSMRLESIRDGIEDYQILTMLEKKLGSAALNDMLKKVCTSVVTYTSDDDYLHAVRVQLLQTVENAYN